MRSLPLDTMPATPGTPAIPYAEIFKTILFSSPPNKGLGTDELVRSFEVWGVIKAASESARDAVLLEDADWAILTQRLAGFVWGPLATTSPAECMDVITAIRDAPKVDPNKEGPT